ncbi:MAG: 50S ribosomal protein L31e [Nanoarchaeota archaeon]|nr:50S ribosomal protein L31e [Nanoarchaeota archaeon]
MAKKETKKTEKIEREYIIPLRKQVKIVPRYKKTNKAVRTIKEFLVRHMTIRDRDLKKVRIDRYLNEYLWHQGIRHPPVRVKVRAVKEDDLVRVYLAESVTPAKLKFKKLREEKITKKAKEAIESKKGLMEKAKESIQGKSETTEPEKSEEKKEDKEKEKAGIEATQMIEKEMAKQSKHQEKTDFSKPKHQFRQALEK